MSNEKTFFRCPECNGPVQEKRLSIHMEKVHHKVLDTSIRLQPVDPPMTISNPKAGKSGPWTRIPIRNQKVHELHYETLIQCEFCGHWVKPENMHDHIKQIHPEEFSMGRDFTPRDNSSLRLHKSKTKSSEKHSSPIDEEEAILAIGDKLRNIRIKCQLCAQTIAYDALRPHLSKKHGIVDHRTINQVLLNPFTPISDSIKNQAINLMVECDVCGIPFQLEELENHRQTHYNPKPKELNQYSLCPDCKLYIQKGRYKVHQKMSHSESIIVNTPQLKIVVVAGVIYRDKR